MFARKPVRPVECETVPRKIGEAAIGTAGGVEIDRQDRLPFGSLQLFVRMTISIPQRPGGGESAGAIRVRSGALDSARLVQNSDERTLEIPELNPPGRFSYK